MQFAVNEKLDFAYYRHEKIKSRLDRTEANMHRCIQEVFHLNTGKL